MSVLRRAAALIPVLLVVAIVAVGVPMGIATAGDFGPGAPVFFVVFPALIISLGLVGGFLAFRVPGNAIGWILELAGVAMAISTFGGTYVTYDHEVAGGGLPLVVPIAWLASWLIVTAIGVLVIYLPLLFPTGRFLSRRWRVFGLAALVPATLAAASASVQPGPLSSAPWIDNPVGLRGADDLLSAAQLLGNLPTPFVFGAAILSVVLRYRRAGRQEREQLKWFAFVVSIAVTAFLVSIPNNGPVSDVAWIVGLASLATLPVAIAIAILRYRLYEIDRIISRTVSYAVMTALLAGLFAGLVVGLEQLLAPVTSSNGLAVAASTLVVFAAFAPLRRRVQGVVDRRFNRARYDADRVVAGFAGRLRGEVELEALVAGIDDVARRTVDPVSAAVWLRAGRG